MNRMMHVIAAGVALSVAAKLNADTIEIDGVTWTYSVNDASAKTITLGGGSSTDTAMPKDTLLDTGDIPWTFEIDSETYTVTKLAYGAFWECTNLVGVLSVPYAVTEIGERAFTGCTRLTGIKSLGGDTTMAPYVFNNDTNIGGEMPDLSLVTSFENGVFQFCNGLTGEVKFNSSLTEIPNRLFYFNWKSAGSITKLDIPRSVTSIGDWAFRNSCSQLPSVWVKGPETVSSGTQTYTSISANQNFCASSSILKIAVFGPNTKIKSADDQSTFFGGTTDCKLFVPANGYWDALTSPGGTDTQVIFYGPGQAFDMDLDDTNDVVTFFPTTEEALVNVLTWAPEFKEQFGLDPVVNVTNAISLTTSSITSDLTDNVKLGSLIFSVTSQTQLDAVLAAVSSAATIGIDPAGATENLLVPAENLSNVWVKLPAGCEYKIKPDGMVIICR